jgi:hypothetical protein
MDMEEVAVTRYAGGITKLLEVDVLLSTTRDAVAEERLLLLTTMEDVVEPATLLELAEEVSEDEVAATLLLLKVEDEVVVMGYAGGRSKLLELLMPLTVDEEELVPAWTAKLLEKLVLLLDEVVVPG